MLKVTHFAIGRPQTGFSVLLLSPHYSLSNFLISAQQNILDLPYVSSSPDLESSHFCKDSWFLLARNSIIKPRSVSEECSLLLGCQLVFVVVVGRGKNMHLFISQVLSEIGNSKSSTVQVYSFPFVFSFSCVANSGFQQCQSNKSFALS